VVSGGAEIWEIVSARGGVQGTVEAAEVLSMNQEEAKRVDELEARIRDLEAVSRTKDELIRDLRERAEAMAKIVILNEKSKTVTVATYWDLWKEKERLVADLRELRDRAFVVVKESKIDH
jgi:hypothetical protein